MKKRFLLCLVALLCCLVAFVACGKGPDNTDAPVADIVLVENGESKFVIVGDESANYIKTFVSNAKDVIGSAPEVYAKGEAPEGKIQIIVGNPETLELTDEIPNVSYFGYSIKAKDGNMYVLAYDNTVLGEATSYLYLRFEEFFADGSLKFAGDYSYAKSTSNIYGAGEAPYLEGGKNARVFDADTKHQLVILDEVEKAEFEAYNTKLVSLGYALHSENDMNGNLFKTYTKDGVMLHTYWIEYSKEVRTVVAKTSLLPITSVGANNSGVPTLYQLKATTSSAPDGGMGYIIELADGRFIIFDGGGDDSTASKAIYDYLKANANDPNNIVIATWYISHGHGDHYGAFANFAKNYSGNSSIKIESFMYNQCYTALQSTYIDVGGDAAAKAAMAKYYPTVPVYKPLTGQKYTFSTTTIEILYTMPDYMPNVIPNEADATPADPKKGNGNIMTMVCKVDIVNNADKDDLFMVMGDTTKVNCDEMVKRYKTYLKSDIVQVSHHGLATDSTDPAASARRHNSSKEFYMYVNPDIALWPTSYDAYLRRKVFSVNVYLEQLVDVSYISGEGNTPVFKFN